MARKLEPQDKKRALGALVSIVSEMISGDTPLTPMQLRVFVIIAENDGITQTEIVARTGLSQPTVSRMLQVLGPHPTRGLGLVQPHVSPYDSKERMMSLTSQGRQMINRLCLLVVN